VEDIRLLTKIQEAACRLLLFLTAGSKNKRMQDRVVITVDGLAGSGKTTLSKMLARRLGFAHLNSGLLYRAAGFIAVRDKISFDSPDVLVKRLLEHKLELKVTSSGDASLFLNGEDVTPLLRSAEVSEATSEVSKYAPIREALLEAQVTAFSGHHLVAEGRDMGTVVFPQAQLKFFITAELDVRLARRLKDFQESARAGDARQLDLLKEDLKKEVLERDERDSQREVAPTKPAEGAIIIDNSTQTLTKVLESMYDAVSDRGLDKVPSLLTK